MSSKRTDTPKGAEPSPSSAKPSAKSKRRVDDPPFSREEWRRAIRRMTDRAYDLVDAMLTGARQADTDWTAQQTTLALKILEFKLVKDLVRDNPGLEKSVLEMTSAMDYYARQLLSEEKPSTDANKSTTSQAKDVESAGDA